MENHLSIVNHNTHTKFILVYALTGCLIPGLLFLFGFNFDSLHVQQINTENLWLNNYALALQLSSTPIRMLLGYTAFIIIVFSLIIAFIRYSATTDITVPVIGAAILFAGSLDLFCMINEARVYGNHVNNHHSIAYMWLINHIASSLALCLSTVILLRLKHLEFSTINKFTPGFYLLLVIIAYFIIDTTISLEQIPQTILINEFSARPYELIPFGIYLFTGIYLLPRLYQSRPSIFSYAFMIAMIPLALLELHLIFGSKALFDAHDNVTFFLKLIAYSTPLVGLIADYSRLFKLNEKEITKRKNAEMSFKQIIETQPTPLVIIDMTGIITYLNQDAEKLFGYQSQELINKPIEMLVPSHMKEKHVAYRSHYCSSPIKREMSNSDFCAVRKDGEEITVTITLNPIDTPEGLRILASIYDLRGLKKAEQKLKRYTNDLERSNSDLDQFAYVASHDLKAPLRGLDQLSCWIREDIDDKETLIEHSQLMQNRIHRMERLLDDLLAYARIGRIEEKFKEIDTKTLLQDIFTMCSPPENFSLILSDNLPTLLTLSTPLAQIFRNLLSNAIKHHDRPNGKVKVTYTENDQFHIFAVTDDGPGIPAELHKKAFGIFQTLKPRDVVEGSGMGLAVIEKIINTYQGSIELTSDTGQGACFTLRWPKNFLSPNKHLIHKDPVHAN